MSTPTLLLLANSVLILLVGLFILYLLAVGVTLLNLRSQGVNRLAERILGRDLRSSFTNGLILLAGVLPIILGIVLAQRSAEQARVQIDDRLVDTTNVLTQSIDAQLSEYVRAIDSLSKTILERSTSADSVSGELAEVREIYKGFLTMLVADEDGKLIASVPNLEEFDLGADSGLLDVSDRDYFFTPRETGMPFVSDIFQGRGFGRDPIIAISAPIYDNDGNFQGIVEASIDLATFWDLREFSLRWSEAETLIVDRFNRVVHASERGNYNVLDSLGKAPIIESTRTHAAGQTFRFTRGEGEGNDLLAAYGLTDIGWKVYVMMDTRLPDSELAANFRVTAFWALFAAVLGVVLATALHQRIGHPLSHLHELVTKFESEDVDRLLKTDARRRGIPQEFKRIFIEFRNLRRRLMVAITRQREALRESERLRVELEDVVSERERVIARRTAELERANQLLEREAKIDALTGLPNRRGGQEFLEKCWRTSQRRATPMSVILIDVDHFKNYNDEHGHAAGDSCLQEVGAELERHCRRATDLASRWGGEEFLVVLGDTELEDARQVAEEIREAIEAEAANWTDSDSGDNRLTISAGVASTEPQVGDQQIDKLIAAADEALYRSKRDGRNQVTVSAARA